MEKTITFNIPEGYVIDKENSTDTNIVLKKIFESTKSRTWEEYCKKMRNEDSCYFVDWNLCYSRFGLAPMVSEFADKEDAEAFAALSKLLKLRKDWVGDWKPNWTNGSQRKYIICRYENRVTKDLLFSTAHCLSFPTKEMCDEFFECFKDLLEQAKDLI